MKLMSVSFVTKLLMVMKKVEEQQWKNVLQRDQDINVVYTINEPAAVGAYEGAKKLLAKMMVAF